MGFNSGFKGLSSSLCNFLHSPFTSSFSGPNILLNTIFSNTLSLCSFLHVSDQVSHPNKATGKITGLYIFNHKFWIANWKKKIPHRVIASIPRLQPARNFVMNRILICWGCALIFELFHPCKEFITYLYFVISSCLLVSRHVYTQYSIFSAFISIPVSLLRNPTSAVLFFIT